ncbi:MAG: response regulator [Burkholderiaceae bacterium]
MELQNYWEHERLRVVVVDDHPEIVDYISMLLEKSCDVFKAYDAVNGLALARSANPDLIVADIAMPGISGLDLLQNIRADPAIHSVPVIMLSGMAGEDVKIEALIKGADDYLVKPFKPRELLVRIHAQVRMVRLRRDAYQKEIELSREIGVIRQDMQSILENTKDAYLSLDRDFRVLSFNKAALHLTDAGSKLIAGQPLHECAPDLAIPVLESALRDALVNSEVQSIEYRSRRGSWHELRIYPSVHGISILGADITEKKESELLLIAAQEQLERRVRERTKALQESNKLLQDSERHQQLLYQRLDAMRDEERTALSREVHDQLGQILSAAKIDIRLLEDALSGNSSSLSRDAIVDELQSARQIIEQGIQVVRNIAKGLRTPHLDAEGLFEAIQVYACQFEAKTKIACHVHVQDRLPLPCREVAQTLYRIYQEAMTNILRHAHASEVAICLHNRGRFLHMRIVDNGVGINRESGAATGTLGLLGMKERAASLQGHCRIGRMKGSGTIVSIMVPVFPNPNHPGPV